MYPANRARLPLVAVAVATSLIIAASSVAVAQSDDDGVDAASFPQVETKLKRLKKRVKHLESQVAELQTLNLPVTVEVDCGSGGKIGDALTTYALGKGQLTINVTGACTEALRIARSDVALVGGAGATLQTATGSVFGLQITDGAHNVTVTNFTLSGGTSPAIVTKNAHATFTNVVARGGNFGVGAFDGGTLDVTGSRLTANNFGAYAIRSGVVSISNTTIEGNTTGVIAFKGGTIYLTSVTPAGPATTGPLVRGNTTAGVARSGGVLELSDTRIEANAFGLLADSGSSIHFFNTLNSTGNVITGNGGPGVLAQRTSALVFSDATNTITGNVIGILCQNGPSYIVPAGAPSPGPGNVSGNTNGNIVGCITP